MLVLGDFGSACWAGDPYLSEEECACYQALLTERSDATAAWRLWQRVGVPREVAEPAAIKDWPSSTAIVVEWLAAGVGSPNICQQASPEQQR